MKGEVVYSDQDGRLIKLYIRGEDGNKYKLTITDFYPYFYVPDSNGSYRAIDGRKLRKIITQQPGDVKRVRENFKMHYEADIRYTQRFLIDIGVKAGIEFDPNTNSFTKLKPAEVSVDKDLCYFDIEMNENEQITCLTLYSTLLNKYITLVWREDLSEGIEEKSDNWLVFKFNNERSLLIKLIKIFEDLDFDILIAYNLIGFDWSQLEKRLQYYNLRLIRTFDLFDIYKAYHIITNGRKESYHLKNVVIDEGIADPSEIEEYEEDWWRKDIEKLIHYNMKDVKWIVELDRRKNLLKEFEMRKKLAGLAYYYDPLSDINIYNQSPPVDVAVLRRAREVGVILPSKSKVRREKFQGAFVYLKQPGLYKDIANYDFSQYYPSIMLSFKLDPLILANYYKQYKVFDLERYVKFANDWVNSGKPTLLLEIIKEAQLIRKKVDEELAKLEPGTKQYIELCNKKSAVKAFVNSIYGVLGHQGFRLMSVELAGSVTSIGREGIIFLKEAVEKKYGYSVIYADTDGLFLKIPFEKATNFQTELTGLINDFFYEKYGVETNIKMKFEKYCSAVFFESKKHYSAKVTFEDGKECDYIDIKGSEAIRRDESKFTRRMLKEFYEIVLNGSAKQLPSWFAKKLNEFKNSPIEDIVIPTTLQKPLHKYQKKDVFIRGAIYANNYLGCNITRGRVYLLYVKGIPGYPPTDAIAVDDVKKIPDNVIIDWPRMIERCLTSKLERRFAILGYGFRTKQTTLV